MGSQQATRPVLPARTSTPCALATIGVMMLSHHQHTEFQTLLHQALGVFLVLTAVLRYASYERPQWQLAAGMSAMVSAVILSTAGKEFPAFLISAGWMGHQWLFTLLGLTSILVFAVGCFTVWWRKYCIETYGEYRELFHSAEQRRKLVYFAFGVLAVFLLLVLIDQLLDFGVVGSARPSGQLPAGDPTEVTASVHEEAAEFSHHLQAHPHTSSEVGAL